MTARLDSVEPLVDPERLAAWMDAQDLERGAPIDGRAHHDRTLERGVPGHARRASVRVAPAAAHAAVADRARHGARVPVVARVLRSRRGSGAGTDRMLRRSRRAGRALLSDGADRRRRRARADAGAARRRSRRAAGVRATRSSTRSRAFTRSTGRPAVSPTSAGPRAISSARFRAGSDSSSGTRPARCPTSTPRVVGCRRTRRRCNRRP